MSDTNKAPSMLCMAPDCPERSSVMFPAPDSPSGDGWGYVCHAHAEELAGEPLEGCCNERRS